MRLFVLLAAFSSALFGMGGETIEVKFAKTCVSRPCTDTILAPSYLSDGNGGSLIDII